MSNFILRKWNEDTISDVEEFKVLQGVRAKAQGDTVAKPYWPGDTMKIGGLEKKDLYFQNKIVYPDQYEKAAEALAAKRGLRVADQPVTADQITGKKK